MGMKCLACEGKGTVQNTVHFGDKTTSFETVCVWCNGLCLMTIEQVKAYKGYQNIWCDKNDCEFESYPDDGECNCGIYKHHVHCQHGKIVQIG